jgi:hypothetical protein
MELIQECACGSGDLASYKCITCVSIPHLCLSCIKNRHQISPFHRIVRWNGSFLEGVQLSTLGITISLGHVNGSPCGRRQSHGLITVLDVNGFHEIDISSCGCDSSELLDLQMFSSRLFAASTDNPKTAFTFDVLEQYRLVNLEAKITAHSFMQALVRLTTDEYIGAWPSKVSCKFSAINHLTNIGSWQGISSSDSTMELPDGK